MSKLTKTAFLSISTLLFMACSGLESNYNVDTEVCHFSMSHNDYAQEKPLFNALNNGINCVEADLFLRDGIIYVAHTEDEISLDNTFENLYLAPLKKIIEQNNGSVYSDDSEPFYLYVDIKSDNEAMPYITQLLDKYSSILTRIDANGYHPASIKVIGGKWKNVKDQKVRYLFAEAKAEVLDSDLPKNSVFIVNNEWSNFFTWNGAGDMPINEEILLREMVKKAHHKGRIIRFWGVEETPGTERTSLWKKLRECGVDLISSDDLVGLKEFHKANTKTETKESPGVVKTQITSNGIDIYFNDSKRLENGTNNSGSTIKGIKLSDNIMAIVGDSIENKLTDYTLFFNSIPNLKQGIASYLFGNWESWTKPIAFSTIAEFPKEKVEFTLWQYTDGLYAVMVPLCNNDHISMLGQSEQGIGAISRSFVNNTYDEIPFMVIGFDKDPYQLVSDIYKELMPFMGKDNNLREHKEYPVAFDNLTWCTWNAMYDDVSEAKISNGIRTFSDKGIKIPTLLIDDGWLDISEDNKLNSYNFDKKKFPKGAKSVFDNLRNNYGVKEIGVWHTMNGYWAGIDPDGELYKAEKDNLIAHKDKQSVHDKEYSSEPYFSPSPKDNKAYNFYNTWYSYLKEQGVTFVKVDQQSVIKRIAQGDLGSGIEFGEVANNMEQSLQRAVRDNFNGQIINCQDMATETLYNIGTSAIIRNSDDYFPYQKVFYSRENEKGNAAAHAIMNLHNALWISEIAWADYDMFQSHHIDAGYHATLRTISGGPIFLTDVPGKQNIDLIKKVSLSNGEIIRADIPAKPTKDCLFNINIDQPFKAFSMIGNSGLLGIWNTDDEDKINGSWSASDVEELSGDNFVAYEHISNKLLFIDRDQEVPVELGRLKYEYWNIVPMNNECAVIGLVNKFNSPGTIIASVIRPNSVNIKLEEGGDLRLVIPNSPKEVLVDGVAKTDWSYNNKLLSIDIDNNDKNIIVAINY